MKVNAYPHLSHAQLLAALARESDAESQWERMALDAESLEDHPSVARDRWANMRLCRAERVAILQELHSRENAVSGETLIVPYREG